MIKMGITYYIDIIIGTKFTFDDIKPKYKENILKGEYEKDEFNFCIEDIFDDKIKCTCHKNFELDNNLHIYNEKDYFCISIKGLKHVNFESMNDEDSTKAKSWTSSGGYRQGIDIDYEKFILTNDEKQLIENKTFELVGKKIPIKIHVFTDCV